MKVIIPNELRLLSCSEPVLEATEGIWWDKTVTYAKDALVRYYDPDTTARTNTYQSLVDDNKNKNPRKYTSGTSATWKNLGAINRHKMLDNYLETQTLNINDAMEDSSSQRLAFKVPFDGATAFALVNITAEKLFYIVDETDDEYVATQELERKTANLVIDTNSFSFYDYCLSPIYQKTEFVRTGLPYTSKGTLYCRLTTDMDSELDEEGNIIGGWVGCGKIVVGREQFLGQTKYDAEVSITDYSRKTVDDFGWTTLTKRSYAKHSNLSLYVVPSKANFVTAVLSSIRATPCVFVGDNNDTGSTVEFDPLTIYGWLEDWRLVYAGPNEVELSLEIQGLI